MKKTKRKEMIKNENEENEENEEMRKEGKRK